MLGVISTLLALAMVAPAPAQAPGLDERVTLPRIQEHLNALQHIADTHDDNRASGTSGYDASARYVADRLRRAGYQPSFQRFQFNFFGLLAPPVLRQDAPGSKVYDPGDYLVFDGSGSGTVDAAVTAVPPGCPSGPPPDFPPGNIALIQQLPGCGLEALVAAAQSAGARAVLIYRAAATSAGADDLPPPRRFDIPVLGIASPAVAAELRELAGRGLRMHIETKTVSEVRSTVNVLADTRRDRDHQDRHVVVAGAHLDSVVTGPGINDNGTSVAALLAIAEQLPKTGPTRNSVRFAFWGAEEPGFIGSTYYVDRLSAAERDSIALNLNLEMLGSPNPVRFVADGDNSEIPAGPDVVAGPPGSGAIEELLAGYFAGRGLPVDRVGLLARSDHVPFALAGIPVGMLFSGAEGLKTEEQAQVYGGTAGPPYDPCYHKACDTVDNLNLTVLDQQADAAAFAVQRFASASVPSRR